MSAATRSVEVLAEGLGHPEGPCVLPDGRVVFANTYASEIGVWEPGKGKGTYAYVGGGPNACMLGSDGWVYSTQCPTVGAWVAPERRPPSIQRSSGDGDPQTKRHRGYIVVLEHDGTGHVLEELAPTYPNGIVAEPDGSIVWVE